MRQWVKHTCADGKNRRAASRRAPVRARPPALAEPAQATRPKSSQPRVTHANASRSSSGRITLHSRVSIKRGSQSIWPSGEPTGYPVGVLPVALNTRNAALGELSPPRPAHRSAPPEQQPGPPGRSQARDPAVRAFSFRRRLFRSYLTKNS